MKSSNRLKPLILFTASRYFNYLLQLVRGIIIAKYLGPFYFGIWGFVTMAIAYLSYTSFGVESGVTVILSIGDENEKKDTNKISSIALISEIAIAILIIILGIILFLVKTELFPKFGFNKYLFMVLGITGLTNIQQLFSIIHRIKKSFFRIAIVESVTAILLLIAAFIFKEQKLIHAQLFCMIITSVLGILVYSFDRPFIFQFKFNFMDIWKLFKVSIPLFLYNLSFYLIPLCARTVLSIFYSVEQLGYYSLAYSLSNAVLLGFRTIAWVIYPDVLVLLHDKSNLTVTRQQIGKINRIYSTSVFFILFLIIIILPMVMGFLPRYESAFSSIIVLLLSQGILVVSFGYNSLAISRNFHKLVAVIGVVVIVIIILLSISAAFFKLNFLFIAIAVLIGSFVYLISQVILGARLLDSQKEWVLEFATVMPPGTIIAVGFCILSAFQNEVIIWQVIGLCLFLILNHKRLKEVFTFVMGKTAQVES